MKKILNPKPVKKAVKKSVKRTGRALVNPPVEKVTITSKGKAFQIQRVLGDPKNIIGSNPPRTLKSISVKSAGFVKLLKNQDKEIRWSCVGLNGEKLSSCENMKRKADVLQNMILTHKLLGKMTHPELLTLLQAQTSLEAVKQIIALYELAYTPEDAVKRSLPVIQFNNGSFSCSSTNGNNVCFNGSDSYNEALEKVGKLWWED